MMNTIFKFSANVWLVRITLAFAMSLSISLTLNNPAIANTQVPIWYSEQSVQQIGFYVGYGESDSLEVAKANARADLAKQLSSKITTALNQSTRIENGELQSSASRELSEVSSAELTDLSVLKSIENAGRYYVALGMDIRPLSERAIALFGKIPAAQDKHLLQNAPLWQALSKHYGYLPNLELLTQRNRYLLKANGQIMGVRKSEIPQLFPSVQTSQIQFNLLPKTQTLKPEQTYQVRLQTQTPGYLSYVQVFQNGDTVLLLANQAVQANQAIIFPDPKIYDGLTAELPKGQSKTQDLHLVILCPKPKDFSQLENIGLQNQQNYSKSLQKLPGLVKNCDVLSQIIQIRK